MGHVSQIELGCRSNAEADNYGCRLSLTADYFPHKRRRKIMALIASTRQIALGWLSAAIVLLVSPSLVNATPFGQESSLNALSVTLDQTTDPSTPFTVAFLNSSEQRQDFDWEVKGSDGNHITVFLDHIDGRGPD